MPYILDIATAVPEYSVSKNELVEFYSDSLEKNSADPIRKKLRIISEKTRLRKHGLRIGTVVFLILTERKLNYLLME